MPKGSFGVKERVLPAIQRRPFKPRNILSLFDPNQPVHLTFDTICGSFQTNKTTVGSKAAEIERALRLSQHVEPGLCRCEFVDDFTTVQLSNGMVVSLRMAKQMGLVPPDAMPG